MEAAIILLDYNQAMITSLTTGWARKQKMTDTFLRTMFLEKIRTYNKKYRLQYGDLIICADAKSYWRRSYFPYYKAHRKAIRDASPLDWGLIHRGMDAFKNDLRTYFPFKVIEAEDAEADDVIAYMCKKYGRTEPMLIISSDGDFSQLQEYDKVDQYSPRLQKFVKVDNPYLTLKEKIIRGDQGDGIPNILSDDDCLVNSNKRQVPIRATKIKKWLGESAETFCTTSQMQTGWARNCTLIDFNYIPSHVLDSIQRIESQEKSIRLDGLISYFIANDVSQFIQYAQDFNNGS